MKNAIWTKILVLVGLPFLFVFTGLSVFIGYAVFQHGANAVEPNVRHLAQFNEVTFRSHIENFRLSVQIAAAEIQNINPEARNARSRGENIILNLFENPSVINVWLVFEPNAFDGNDAGHGDEYPGAPSGRYIRSFFRGQNGYTAIPDIDETKLQDPREAYWYRSPMDSGKSYIDIGTEHFFYDYGTEEGPLSSVTIAVPIVRDGRIIGCVGEDILLNETIFGDQTIPGVVSALFLPDGSLRYARDSRAIGHKLGELGFANTRLIAEALSRGQELFLSDSFSPLLGEKGYALFLPLYLRDFNELVYIYTGVSKHIVTGAVTPVLLKIILSCAVTLVIFLILFFYIYNVFSKPLHALTLAAGAIARGDLSQKIVVSQSEDEIGILSRSLYSLVDQFRVATALREQSKKLLELHMRIQNALYTSVTLKNAFDAIMPIISDTFAAYRASLVILIKGTPRVEAVYRTEAESGDARYNRDFEHHGQIVSLLSGKKYFLCNIGGMPENKIDFAGENTTALCIIPILTEGSLRGYVILEGREESGFSVRDDSALCFISDTIAYIMTKRGAAEGPIRLNEDMDIRDFDEKGFIL